jgi:hypothetical protein
VHAQAERPFCAGIILCLDCAQPGDDFLRGLEWILGEPLLGKSLAEDFV